MLQLIYRGHSYNYVPRGEGVYRKSCVVNWRYRISDAGYEEQLLPLKVCRAPQAINWRWQTESV